jgi:hypothetical protein
MSVQKRVMKHQQMFRPQRCEQHAVRLAQRLRREMSGITAPSYFGRAGVPRKSVGRVGLRACLRSLKHASCAAFGSRPCSHKHKYIHIGTHRHTQVAILSYGCCSYCEGLLVVLSYSLHLRAVVETRTENTEHALTNRI